MAYRVHRALGVAPLEGRWDAPEWAHAQTAQVDQFRQEGSGHTPVTQVRLVYTSSSLHGIFRVEDRFVRSVHTGLNDMVCEDSCVEFFVQPEGAPGYFNFEFNAGGTMHAGYITDPTRVDGGFKACKMLTPEDASVIGIHHSLPAVIEPELDTPVIWTLQFRIPIRVLERYTGRIGDPAGRFWRGNFYKCGDKTSHPHWAAWSAVTQLNFHDPLCFGALQFDKGIE